MSRKLHVTFQGTTAIKDMLEEVSAEMGLPISEILRRVVHYGILNRLYRKPIPRKSRKHER